jgi:hypothetical protein
VQDFSSAKKIKLRAADGTVIDYTVTVYALFDGVDSLAGLYEYTDWTRAENQNPAPMPDPAKPLYIVLAGFTGFKEVPPVTRHPGITYPEAESHDYTIGSTSIMRIMGVESYGDAPLPGYVHNQYIALDVSALSDEALSSAGCPFGHDVGYTDGPFARVTSIKLPANLKSIGESLFQGNETLSSIDLPEGLEEISYAAFAGVTNLKSIKLPATLKKIGVSAFVDTGLESIDLPEGLETIMGNAFSNTQIERVTLPSTITTLVSAFSNIDTLKYADYSKSQITKLTPGAAFAVCPNLEEVRLPKTLSSPVPEEYSVSWTPALDDLTSTFYSAKKLKLEKLVIYAEVPPTMYRDYKIVNSGNNINLVYEQNANFPTAFKIYVPDASLETYKAAAYTITDEQGTTWNLDGWKQYADKIHPLSELGGAQ